VCVRSLCVCCFVRVCVCVCVCVCFVCERVKAFGCGKLNFLREERQA
jgi:hypothetical protein